MQPHIRSIRKLLVILSVLIVVFLLYQAVRSQQFHVVNTNPSISNVATASPFFKVNFNKTLSKNDVSVVSSYSIISSYEVQGKTLIINLNTPLTTKRTYYIKINSISDTNRHKISSKAFVFVPKDVPSKDLPADQGQAILRKQGNYYPSSPASDPIIAHLPYSTLDFSLSFQYATGSGNNSGLVLQAQLLIAPGVVGAEATTAADQYKQEVIDYIKSLDLDPTKYNIQYQVVNETITGT